MLQLKDPTLLRQQAYVDGAWVGCRRRRHARGRAIPRPASGSAPCRDMGAAETRRAIEAASKALPRLGAKTAKERAQDPAALVRPHDGESGRPRACS